MRPRAYRKPTCTYHMFKPRARLVVFTLCTLSYIAPDEVKAADNPDAASKNCLFPSKDH